MKASDIMTSPVLSVGPETQELERQDWWRLDRANVIVTDRVVHFWGMVESDDARPAARVAAENVPGVRGVEDHRFLSYNAPTMT